MADVSSFILGKYSMSYPVQESFLNRWEPESTAAKSFLSAFLTTIISFQLTTIIFEIAFGFKMKGRAQLRDLHLKLLANEASPLKAADSLFRFDWLTRMTRLRDISANTKIRRDKRQIRTSTTFKLMILLLSGPIANIAAVVLGLEKDETYRFEDLGVKTLKFGFTDRREIIVGELTSDCSVQKINVQRGEDALTNFFICYRIYEQGDRGSITVNYNFTITVKYLKNFGMNLFIEGDTSILDWDFTGLMLVKEGRFRVQPSLEQEDLQRFAKLCKKRIEEKCELKRATRTVNSASVKLMNGNQRRSRSKNGSRNRMFHKRRSRMNRNDNEQYEEAIRQEDSSDANVKESPKGASQNFSRLVASEKASCEVGIVLEDLIQAGDQIRDHIRFVNGSSFSVVNEDIVERYQNTDNEDEILSRVERGEKLTLLTRRRSNVSILVLAILSGCVLFLRTVSHFVCHDDLLFGIENILREHFSMARLDSMLQSDDPVDIDQPARVYRNHDPYDPEDYDSDMHI